MTESAIGISPETTVGSTQRLNLLLIQRQEASLARHEQSLKTGEYIPGRELVPPAVISLDPPTAHAVDELRRLVAASEVDDPNKPGTPTAFATAMRVSRSGSSFSPFVQAPQVDKDELAIRIVAHPSTHPDKPTAGELLAFAQTGATALITTRGGENYLLLRTGKTQGVRAFGNTRRTAFAALAGLSLEDAAGKIGVECYKNTPQTPHTLKRMFGPKP